jgi:DNA-binding response OmpR family regulator
MPTRYKVLIVEDEIIVALDIKNTLNKIGIKVTNFVVNYDEAILNVTMNIPDLILMDINLKNSKDGIETAIAIQKIKDIPIIYITAFNDDLTINRAILTNPIHYMIKPFRIEELKSTVRLALYKIEQKRKNINKFIVGANLTYIGNGYFFDKFHQSLFYQNMPVKLGLKEKKLLTILLEARGNIVSFDQLVYEIWSEETISDSTLRTLIYRLRTKLEYKLIKTIPSFGCKLIPSN